MAGPNSGVMSRAAIKRPGQTTAFGDGAGAMTNQIPLLSESLTNGLTFDEEEAVVGSAGKSDIDIVAENPGGTITTDLWYESLEYLFFAAMGFECPTTRTTAYGVDGTTNDGSPAPDVFATPRAWHHLLELDNTLHRSPWEVADRKASSGSAGDATFWDGTHRKVRSVDVMIDKGEPNGYVWRFMDCMVRAMTIRASLDGVTAEWDLTGYKHDLVATGSAGTWAFPTNAFSKERAVFPHLWVGLSAAGSQPTAVSVKEITLTLTNPLDEAWASGTAPKYKIEPIRSGVRSVKGTIKLARYTSDTFPAALRAETDLALDMKFASSNIIKTGANASTLSWVNTLQFCAPLVRITKANFPVSGAGIIEGDIEFECFIPDAVPSWITGAGKIADKIGVKKSAELYVAMRNSRGGCWARDNYTGYTPWPTALP